MSDINVSPSPAADVLSVILLFHFILISTSFLIFIIFIVVMIVLM